MSSIQISVLLESEKEPIEFNFTFEKSLLNWDTLAHSIIESTSTCIELPMILYYKNNNAIESLETQEQFEALLTADVQGLRLYGQRELVSESVFVLPAATPAAPGNAFLRLGQLIDRHKQVISSSRRLSRCVGILASAIAMDTNNKDFDKEFKALEKVIEIRKDDMKAVPQQQDADEKTLNEDQQQAEDSLDAMLGSHRRGGHHRGFGPGFGGRDIFGEEFGHRGGHRGGRGCRSEFRGGHHYRGDFGKEFGGRGGGRHHHRGGPADFFSAVLVGEEKLGGKKHRQAQACFRGRNGGSSSFDGDSSAEEIEALRNQLLNTHINKHDKGFKKHRHHHHHHGGSSYPFGYM